MTAQPTNKKHIFRNRKRDQGFSIESDGKKTNLIVREIRGPTNATLEIKSDSSSYEKNLFGDWLFKIAEEIYVGLQQRGPLGQTVRLHVEVPADYRVISENYRFSGLLRRIYGIVKLFDS